jgi:tRNA isopentenyl-2-thiomethyl-A-37 hydroxylase MiaE
MFFVNYKKLYSKICSDLATSFAKIVRKEQKNSIYDDFKNDIKKEIKKEVIEELVELIKNDAEIFRNYDEFGFERNISFCQKVANLIMDKIDSKLITNNMNQEMKIEKSTLETVNQYIAKEDFIDNIVDRILKKQIGR